MENIRFMLVCIIVMLVIKSFVAVERHENILEKIKSTCSCEEKD
jgi:hypothetical protein